jgi:hypothetical protein
LSSVCSIFNQLTALFPRGEFEQAVRKHKAERHGRGFRCWTQFVAMLFCQLTQAQSLREICGGLKCSEGKLQHLGVESAPPRSTLSYANEHRPWELYQTVFEQLYGRCRGELEQARAKGHSRKHKFRFKHRLMSIDASLVMLLADAFDWVEYHRGKGAVKLHLALDHEGYLPRFAVLSGANKPEVTVAREWKFPRGATLLFDKGFTDYAWFDELTDDGVKFVTRFRRDGHYETLCERAPPQGSRVRSDRIIRLGAERRVMRNRLRRIECEPEQGHEEFVLLTNNFRIKAETAAALYRERWQIEQFFRLLKQNLRLKSFVGTSANAVLIQIWTALIAMLLLKYLMLRAKFAWSFANLLAMLRLQLFVYRDLQGWLDQPFRAPPTPEGLSYEQLSLPFVRP